ncbi:MAG: polyhydroxyalkanoate synthesis regulator DNA-binding domain-containing protein [Deltaproteobacteria bacterium]|nr:polyhydroxyalkanoate synthesis regulator DNA-binding domain-containing protein [Deltaproteobacteria bacterium]
MQEKIMYKKYGNRRLYDTKKSAYVTLSQVADMIKAGHEAEVIDAKTKEDVTAFILTQIILEEAKKKNALLPVPLLHLIIRYGENVLQEFFNKYLQQIIQNYLEFKKAFDEQFGKWLNMSTDYSEMAQKTLADLSPFHSFFNQFAKKPKEPEKK